MIPLSIIIPIYNKEKYIYSCLSSLLKQSWQDFEIIVIDDGSTDNSNLIISEFVLKDDRVKLYSGPNLGVSSARNKGLKYAQGEFIMFVDADDLIEAGYLQRIMLKTKEYDADMYLWGLTKIWQDRQEVIVSDFSGYYTQQDFMQIFVIEQYKTKQGLYGFIPNKLLRRSFINQFHIEFNRDIKKMEDYDFYLQCYSYIRTIYIFPEAGYYYQMATENSSASLIKKVDYLSIIDIHLKCVFLLEAKSCLRTNIRFLLNETITNLILAAFLEQRKVTFADITFLLLELKNRELYKHFKYSGKKWRILNFLIKHHQKVMLYAYLKLWNLYLLIRKG